MLSRNLPQFNARMGLGFAFRSRVISTFTYVLLACLCMGACSRVPCSQRPGKGVGSLGLESQVFGSCPVWALGTEPRPLQEQQALFSTKPSFLLPSLWDTLTNVVDDKYEGKASYFFLRKIHLLIQPQKREYNLLGMDRQQKHVARSQGTPYL